MSSIFNKKNILVTGGAGSIGSAIVRLLLKKGNPQQIRIFDNDEESLFNLSYQFPKNKKLRFLMGDIRDKERISWAMRNIDYVFHAAALKHVALNEYNPFEAIKTNVLGTENVLLSAIKNKVKKVINISTDKATIPTSTMGASKLLAERIVSAVNLYKGKSKTICSSVRFGNVLASSGSVIPIFQHQIKTGGPITITSKKMVRYFMTIDEAVALIFKAIKLAIGGEIFILKMPSLKIIDLAEAMIELANLKKKSIKIKEIGLRPGEKIKEKLINNYESKFAFELKDMFIILPCIEYGNLEKKEIKIKFDYYFSIGAKKIGPKKLQESKILTKKEIKKLLLRAKII